MRVIMLSQYQTLTSALETGVMFNMNYIRGYDIQENNL